MRFPDLVVHGLSAISVFSDVVGARLLLLGASIMIVSVILLVLVLALRVFTGLAIPGWATTAAGTLTVLVTQAMVLITVLAFITLANRSQVNVIPLKDVGMFVDDRTRLFEAADERLQVSRIRTTAI